jgi:pyruvate dehydrogenase E2 component (dihydrolipoamide acetyltransferase)
MADYVSFRGVRKVIAQRMMDSLRNTAQLTYHTSIDITPLMDLLAVWKSEGRKPGLQDCLLFALNRALKAHPLLNGSCDETGYTPEEQVRFSLALSTKNGLVSPVMPSVEGLSLADIAVARRALVVRALEGDLKISDFKGGTFTVSNLGLTAVEYFTPILNSSQIAILGIGRLMPALALNEGKVVTRQALPLSLTADHRVVDGAPAGEFLTELTDLMRATDWSTV